MLRSVLSVLRRRALLPLWALVLAAVVLLFGLSRPGLWEPQEMRVADRAVERLRGDAGDAAAAPTDCPQVAGEHNVARTLTPRLAAAGRQAFGSSEGALRLGLATLGLLCALAVYGLGARLASRRAGLLSVAILLSFPLMVLQARQLTSELGAAAGAALLVYGAVAAGRPAAGRWRAADLALSAACIAGGGWLAYAGGGALLGLAPPLAAVALAGGLGVAALGALAALLGRAAVRAAAMVRPGLWPALRAGSAARPRGAIPPGDAIVAALALAGLVAALGWLAAEVYDLQRMAPGTRHVLGRSFVASECWAEPLGGAWSARDDGKATYDVLFEQIAFGMFPWSALAPVALLALTLGHAGDAHRRTGRLALAWAGVAWVAATVFARKVDVALYAGFPACALALGTWLDGVLARREAADADPDAPARPGDDGELVIGLWALLGAVTLGKDLQAFTDKLTSLLVGGDAIKYPPVDVLGVPLRPMVLMLGALTGLAVALGLWLWRPGGAPQHRLARALGRHGLSAAVVLSVLFGVFWAQVWQPALARRLSSKHVFSVYQELRGDGDRLGILGDLGNAPDYYAGGAWDRLTGRDALVKLLREPERRTFALAPIAELCPLHRQLDGAAYHVLDDSNAKFLLLSNRLDGATDRNPLATTLLREEPTGPAHAGRRPFSATFDDRIELVGWALPETAEIGDLVRGTLYFRVKKPVSGAWKIFVHVEGQGERVTLDHDPIRGHCATSFWQAGDYVVDRFEGEVGNMGFDPGTYRVYVGFFTGSAPNWRNMKVTDAPPGARDDADRVLLGTIRLR